MTSSLLPRWRRLDPESTSCIHLAWNASSRHARIAAAVIHSRRIQKFPSKLWCLRLHTCSRSLAPALYAWTRLMLGVATFLSCA